MAYQNFIPTVWSEAIERELEKQHIYAIDCNRKWEGDVQRQGDSVRILGVGKPTVTTTTDKNIKLEDPENVEDTSVTMEIDHIAYFNYKVDDIDKRQAAGDGLMDALSEETSVEISDAMDSAIAKLALRKEAPKLDTAVKTVTAENVLSIIDDMIEKLQKNDVKAKSKIVLDISPTFYKLFKQAYIKADTDNSKILENGQVAKYGNAIVKMSNNVAVDSDGAEYIMLRTPNAIAFANPMVHTEPYRPEKGFSDAVKGYALFGTKIVRPKELCVAKVKY